MPNISLKTNRMNNAKKCIGFALNNMMQFRFFESKMFTEKIKQLIRESKTIFAIFQFASMVSEIIVVHRTNCIAHLMY